MREDMMDAIFSLIGLHIEAGQQIPRVLLL